MQASRAAYGETQREAQPAANQGFRPAGTATLASLVLGLAREEAACERRAFYVGFCDKGGYFQSISRRVQRLAEAYLGEPVALTTAIMALHEALLVQVDSGEGLTHGTESRVGNGQGDVAAAQRSMEPLAFEIRAIEWLVAGFAFRTPQGGGRMRIPSTWFADDGALLTDDFGMLRVGFEVMSMMSRVLGFTIGIDTDRDGTPNANKTGWYGVEYYDGQWHCALDETEVLMLDNRRVPRAEAWYKHLGIIAEIMFSWERARARVVARCTGIAAAMARLGVLSAEVYVEVVDVATTTVLAYYGAAFPVGEQACNQIDVAKRRGLWLLGHRGRRTSRWLIHAPRPEGLGMAISWAHAGGALLTELDKAMRSEPDAPVRAAVAHRTAATHWGLGARPTTAGWTPIDFNPWHAERQLREEGIPEAALKYRLMAGVEARAGAGDGGIDGLAAAYDAPRDPEGGDASIWAVEGREWGWQLAKLGGVLRRHFYGGEELVNDGAGGIEVRGRWRTPAELGRFLGTGGKVVGGHRIMASLPAAAHREYVRLMADWRREEEEWVQSQRGGAAERPQEPTPLQVMAARDGRRGQREILVQWSDGRTCWGPRPESMTREAARAAKEARVEWEAMVAEGRTGPLRRQLERRWPNARLWLAMEAPSAVGGRDAAGIVAAAAEAGVQMPGEGDSDGDEDEREERGRYTREELASMAMASEELAARMATMEGASVQAREEVAGERRRTEAALEVGSARMAAIDAKGAAAAAANGSAAAASAAAAAATRAMAEWVAAAARATIVALQEATVRWAQAQPTWADTRRENVEGAGAAAELVAHTAPRRFRPSGLVMCYMGTLEGRAEGGRTVTIAAAAGAAGQHDDRAVDGKQQKGRMRPSLQLDAQAASRAEALPKSMQPPTEAAARADRRVAWGSRGRMWATDAAEAATGNGCKDEGESHGGSGDSGGAGTGRGAEGNGNKRNGSSTGGNDDGNGGSGYGHGDGGSAGDGAASDGIDGGDGGGSNSGGASSSRHGNDEGSLEGQGSGERGGRGGEGGDGTVAGGDGDGDGVDGGNGGAGTEGRVREGGAARRQLADMERLEEAADAEAESQEVEAGGGDGEGGWWDGAMMEEEEILREMARAEGEDTAAWEWATAAEAGWDEERTGAEREATHRREEDTAAGRGEGGAAATAATGGQPATERGTATGGHAAAAQRTEAAAQQQRVAEQRRTARARLEQLSGVSKAERARKRDAEEELAYVTVEYAEAMEAGVLGRVAESNALRLGLRVRAMEQRIPCTESDEGVPIGMEPSERAKIDVEATKEAIGLVRAVEMAHEIRHCYALDGSADNHAGRGAGESGTDAAAWGSWDGEIARGGALPPGVGNQIAELMAIERTLDRHAEGDRIALMCDCQSAMRAVVQAWSRGELGLEARIAGQRGGGLIEQIVRHMVRIAGVAARAREEGSEGGADGTEYTAVAEESGAGEGGPRGCVVFIWVKAHGGGIAPNAYADAIAKSHLAEEPRDIRIERMLPRVCGYAVAAAAGGERYSLLADRSLRGLMIRGMTEWQLRQWETAAIHDATAARPRTRLDRRILAAVSSASGGGSEAAPSQVGRSMRLRADDMGLRTRTSQEAHAAYRRGDDGGGDGGTAGEDGEAEGTHEREAADDAAEEARCAEEGECWLCGVRAVDGDHCLRCEGAGAAQRRAAQRRVERALEEAHQALPGTAPQVPNATTRAEWTRAANVAAAGGLQAVVEGMGEQGAAAAEGEGAMRTLSAEWHSGDRSLELDLNSDTRDGRAARWCAAAVRRAGTAAANTGADAAGWAIVSAAAAIGEVGWDGERGQPRVEEVVGLVHAGGREVVGAARGITRIEVRCERVRRGDTIGIQRQEEQWASDARAAWVAAGGSGWSVHTKRGFRQGSGAANRKQVVSMAVDESGGQWDLAPPSVWPWRVVYRVHVTGGTRAQDAHAAASGDRLGRTVVTLQLSEHANGELMVSARAQEQRQNGALHGTRGERAVQVPLTLEGRLDELDGVHWDAGVHDLFWVMGWSGGTCAESARARTIREAISAARDGDGWERLRRVMGGEVPEATTAERVAEKRQREDAVREAREAAEAAADAAAETEQARRQERRGERREASELEKEGQRARADAETLGVDAAAEAQALRSAFMSAALRNHPDKGGNASAFRRIKEAHERMRAVPREQRREAAAAAAAWEAGGGADRVNESEATRAERRERVRRRTGMAAEAAAEAAWVPGWSRVADALKRASDAYFGAWTRYRRRAAEAEEAEARRTGWESAAAQRRGRSAQRAAQRKEAARAAEEAAVREMRERERRTMERVRSERAREMAVLREMEAASLLEAMRADWATVKQRSVVRIPWAAWTKERGAHESERLERFRFEGMVGSLTAPTAAGHELWLQLRREGARRDGERVNDGWNQFWIDWHFLTGGTWGMEGRMRCSVTLEQESSSEADASDGEEERDLEAAEVRRARREARQGMRMSEALRNAAAAEEQMHVDGEQQEQRMATRGRQRRRRGGAWWWREAGMGQVAAAEYGASMSAHAGRGAEGAGAAAAATEAARAAATSGTTAAAEAAGQRRAEAAQRAAEEARWRRLQRDTTEAAKRAAARELKAAEAAGAAAKEWLQSHHHPDRAAAGRSGGADARRRATAVAARAGMDWARPMEGAAEAAKRGAVIARVAELMEAGGDKEVMQRMRSARPEAAAWMGEVRERLGGDGGCEDAARSDQPEAASAGGGEGEEATSSGTPMGREAESEEQRGTAAEEEAEEARARELPSGARWELERDFWQRQPCMQRVEIGRMAWVAGRMVAETAPAEGTVDEPVHRGTVLGNRFKMPARGGGRVGCDEGYRAAVVAAYARLLRWYATRRKPRAGRSLAEAVEAAGERDDGHGWRVRGGWERLPIGARGPELRHAVVRSGAHRTDSGGGRTRAATMRVQSEPRRRAAMPGVPRAAAGGGGGGEGEADTGGVARGSGSVRTLRVYTEFVCTE